MFYSQYRSLSLLIGGACLALAAATVPVHAGEKSAAMVIDANTGKVLHDRDGSELRYPASLTKMMTLYIAFETIEAGRANFKTPITISDRAAGTAPSKLGLKAGATIPFRDAIKALIVKSANDMAVAVAEHIGGSETAFAALMTKRARQLGMERTVFRNASGLPDDEQVTTARDMLKLALRLQEDFPQHYRLFSLRSFSYGGKTYRSHNSLLGRFAGVDGIKTGYTRASGFNLVSSYRGSGKHIVAAVMGGKTASVRDAHMRMLLARAIERASTTRTRPAKPQLVAEARPAKRPAAGRVDIPLPVKAPQPPAAVAAASTMEAPAAIPMPRIAIAKVRTVPVLAGSAPAPAPIAADGQPPQAAAAAAPEPQFATAGIMPRPDFAALRARLAAREAETPRAAETAAFRPSEAPPMPAPAPYEPLRIGETIIPKLDGSIQQGRPPSTLQAQLARFDAEPNYLGARPEPEAPAARSQTVALADVPRAQQVATGVLKQQDVRTGYDVQIGVYSSPTDAEQAMAAARSKAAHILGQSDPITMPLSKDGRQLYRARFAGFDSKSAANACNELRRMELDCFVARAN